MKIKFASTALCVLLGLLVIGCGGSNGPSGPPPNSNEVKYKQVTDRIFRDFKKNDPLKLTASLSKPSSTAPLTGSLKIEVQGQPYVFELQNVSLANNGSSISANLVQPITTSFAATPKSTELAELQTLIAAFQDGNQISVDLTVKGTRVTGTATIINGVKTTVPVPLNETLAVLATLTDFNQLLFTALTALLSKGAIVVP